MLLEKAIRTHVRFKSEDYNGLLDTEDLCDLPLTALNRIAKGLNKELKTAEEDDFLEEKSNEDKVIKLKFDVVLYIIKIRKEEVEKNKNASEKKARKAKLLDALAEKENEEEKGRSKEDIIKELNELDDK